MGIFPNIPIIYLAFRRREPQRRHFYLHCCHYSTDDVSLKGDEIFDWHLLPSLSEILQVSNIKSNKKTPITPPRLLTVYTLVHTEEEGRRRTNENPMRQRLLLGRRRGGGGHFCFSHGIWDIWLPWEEEGRRRTFLI